VPTIEEIENGDVEEVIENADEAVEDNNTEEEEARQPEAWELVDEETPGKEGDDSEPVKPVKHLKAKKRLQGKISEQDSEIDKLRAELEAVKNGRVQQEQPPTQNKRPRMEDFETDDDYYAAKDRFEDIAAEGRQVRIENQRKQTEAVETHKTKLEESLEAHYDRADELLKESGMSPEVYKAADNAVRSAVETIRPNGGDSVVDLFISGMGKGSEKVMGYLGRNKVALAKFQNLLSKDPTGIKAAVYLGEQKKRLSKQQTNQTTQARPPVTQLKDGGTATPSKHKKAYDEAVKKGDVSAMFKHKGAAKKAGADVKKW